MLRYMRNTLFALALVVTGAALAGVIGCTGTGSASTWQQAVTDLRAVDKGLMLDAPIISTLYPNLISTTGKQGAIPLAEVMDHLQKADAALALVQGQTLADVTNLQVALDNINLVLGDVAAVAGMVQSSDPRIQAVAQEVEAMIIMAPLVEALVTNMAQQFPATTQTASVSRHFAASRLAAAHHSTLTTDQAKARLHIQ